MKGEATEYGPTLAVPLVSQEQMSQVFSLHDSHSRTNPLYGPALSRYRDLFAARVCCRATQSCLQAMSDPAVGQRENGSSFKLALALSEQVLPATMQVLALKIQPHHLGCRCVSWGCQSTKFWNQRFHSEHLSPIESRFLISVK